MRFSTLPLYRSFAAAALMLLVACVGSAPDPAAETTLTDAQIKAAEARTRLEVSDGGKLVLRAIEAHGGLEAWYNAPTSSYTWEYSNTGADMRFKTAMVVENDSRRAYHDILTLGTPEEAPEYAGSFAWDGEQAWIYPADTPKINPRFWALTGYYFEMIPFVLADPGLRYEVLPDEELDGEAHDMVKVSFDTGVGDAPGDTYTLYLNKDDGMVDAIRYTVTYYSQARPQAKKKAGPPRETLFDYEEYTTVDGLTVPQRFLGYTFVDGKKGEARNEAWCAEISFRKPFDEAKLTMPEGGKVQPMPSE